MVCNALLIEAGDQLVLVETGFGTEDVANPKRLGQPFRAVVRPRCDRSETAIEQIRALGHDPADVRHILVTHLDLDHAGGLPDFPDAEVHVFADELASIERPLPVRERGRQVREQFAHGPRWVSHSVDGDGWFGFESVRVLPGIDAEIALVPLAGHSAGHSGVAVNRGSDWLLHCGDAYFHHGEVETPHSCPPGLRLFQSVVGHDNATRRQNRERLRELARAHAGEVALMCAHDPHYVNGPPRAG